MYKSPYNDKPLARPCDTQESLLKLRDELVEGNLTDKRELLLKLNSCLYTLYNPHVPKYMYALIESKTK